MKICEYCDTQCEESVRICPSCGASDFSHQCANCGSVFHWGNYCPHCGLKVGTPAKKCPNCGREYYFTACPSCGYMPKIQQPAWQPSPQLKTLLWVLGWIFIFPIPTAILIHQNSKMTQQIKAVIVAEAFILWWLIFSCIVLPLLFQASY
jgi:rRNA maturation protein Nop10